MTADQAGRFEVRLTAGAERDLGSIYDFVLKHDGTAFTDCVLDEVSRVVENLSQFPERGSYPKELATLGIKAYRQTFFKPYRVIYRVMDHRVIVYLIVDGRRDMQSVLARRLLAAWLEQYLAGANGAFAGKPHVCAIVVLFYSVVVVAVDGFVADHERRQPGGQPGRCHTITRVSVDNAR